MTATVTEETQATAPGGVGTATVAGISTPVGPKNTKVVMTLDLAPHETRYFPIRDSKTAKGRPLTLQISEPLLDYDRGPLLAPPPAADRLPLRDKMRLPIATSRSGVSIGNLICRIC